MPRSQISWKNPGKVRARTTMSYPGRLCSFQSLHKRWVLKRRSGQFGYGVGLRVKRSSVRIQPWPLRWVLGQGSLLPLSQGEAFTLASISYLAILVKYILAKKKKKTARSLCNSRCMCTKVHAQWPLISVLTLIMKQTEFLLQPFGIAEQDNLFE